MESVLKTCPACGTNVRPDADGKCPACQAVNPIESYTAIAYDGLAGYEPPVAAGAEGTVAPQTASTDDASLSAGDWILVVIFPCIGLLIGLLRLGSGRKNAGTMIAASIGMMVLLGLLRLMLIAASSTP